MTLPPEHTSQLDADAFVDNPLELRCVEVVEIVTLYLDSALDDRDRDAIETHLAGCQDCVIFVSQVRMTITLVGATVRGDSAEPPANLAQLSGLIARRKLDS